MLGTFLILRWITLPRYAVCCVFRLFVFLFSDRIQNPVAFIILNNMNNHTPKKSHHIKNNTRQQNYNTRDNFLTICINIVQNYMKKYLKKHNKIWRCTHWHLKSNLHFLKWAESFPLLCAITNLISLLFLIKALQPKTLGFTCLNLHT